MKTTIRISRTIQVMQYEPYVCDITVETDIDSVDNLKLEYIKLDKIVSNIIKQKEKQFGLKENV